MVLKITLMEDEFIKISLIPGEKLTLRGLINLSINAPEFHWKEIIQKRSIKWLQHSTWLSFLIVCKLSFLKYLPNANWYLHAMGQYVLILLFPLKLIMLLLCLASHFKRKNRQLIFLRKSKWTNRGIIYWTFIFKVFSIMPGRASELMNNQITIDDMRKKRVCGLKWHLLHHVLCPLENIPWCLVVLLM